MIDAQYCLNEGGGGQIKNGKYLVNEVQVSEKDLPGVQHHELLGALHLPQVPASPPQTGQPAGESYLSTKAKATRAGQSAGSRMHVPHSKHT